jgi:cobyrinic acid a,c-diamide synthase
MLFREGESYRVHEFHYWDSDANGSDLHAVKPISGRSWDEAYASHTLYAGFPHLYLAGKPELAARFVKAARKAITSGGISVGND